MYTFIQQGSDSKVIYNEKLFTLYFKVSLLLCNYTRDGGLESHDLTRVAN